MSAGFTKGPLEVGNRYGLYRTELCAPDGSVLAAVWTHSDRMDHDAGKPAPAPSDEGMANLALYRAAPDMHAALTLALPIIEEERAVMVDGYTNRSGPDTGKVTDKEALEVIGPMDEALAAIRAALARAAPPSDQGRGE